VIAPIAHVGHWAINLLYVAPLFVAVGVLAWQARKDRRASRDGDEPKGRRPPTEPPPA
jgi:hypothetical protein